MDRLELAVGLLIVGPVAGAALLAALGAASRLGAAPLPRAVVTLVTLALTVGALAVAFADSGVLGSAVRRPLGFGPLDPSGELAGLAWSAAPVALALLFFGIAARARSRSLLVLSVTQLAIAAVAFGQDLGVVPATEARHVEAGQALVLDPLAATLLAVSALVGALIVVFALGYEPPHLAHKGLPAHRTAMFLAWLVFFLGAMHLLVAADDLRLLAVGWELTTLCSFVLIGFDGDREAIVAARRALAYNLGGGIALAVALVLVGPGATLSGLLERADQVVGGAVAGGLPWFVTLALGGFIVAAATKSALAPFHPWLLGAMVAATPVSALLHASTMVKAGSYLVLRISPAVAAGAVLGPALVFIGGLTFAAAALLALREHDLKRVLALSTVSSLGLIAAAAGLGTPAALAAGILLLAFHAVAKALAFLVVGSFEQLSGTRDLEMLVGIARRNPWLAGGLLAAAGALALPPFGIAVAKWAILVLGAADLVLVVLLSVGGAAALALWTMVAARLVVRRTGGHPPEIHGTLGGTEWAVLGILGVGTLGGLVLAAPVARAVADPAALVAYGREAGLAAGWSVVLAGTGFAVPMVGALIVAAVGVAWLVNRRIPAVAPQPYLAGVNLSPGGETLFHGAMAGRIDATSGGFYWGDAIGEGTRPVGLRRAVLAGGWLAVALVAVASIVDAVGLIAKGGGG